MLSTILIAANFRAIGITVFALLMVAFVALWVRNIFQARDELGSEIEIAPNRKPYYDDEELEGPKLDKSLSFALVVLGLVALALPFYWLAEPGRQEGGVEAYELNFISRGEGTYTVGAQCVNCHSAGGIGGSKSYVLQDADGQFITNANWTAPALNNVLLRYSFAEVEYILNYGRPGSPMAAWGTPGGGPLTEQQVSNVIKYIETLQVQSLDPIDISQADDPEGQQAAADELVAAMKTEVDRSLADGEFDSLGEAVFNLGLFSGYGSGSLSCGRCHTAGWSLGTSVFPNLLDEGIAGCGGGSPSGIGFNLCGDSLEHRFPDDSWKLPDGSWAPAGGSTSVMV
ncbi:MAG: c-type cytochrome [Acidimicrobiales bacterium]